MEIKQTQMNKAAWLKSFLTGTADRLIFNVRLITQFILSLLFMTIVTVLHFHLKLSLMRCPLDMQYSHIFC